MLAFSLPNRLSAVKVSRGRRPKEFLPFQDARDIVRASRLKSWREWLLWNRSGCRPSDVPSNPRLFYRNTGWTDYPDWLGYARQRPGPKPSIERALRRKQRQANARLQDSPRQCNAAKKLFLERTSGGPFEFQILPHRSIAQFVYRQTTQNQNETKGEENKWCPLVLRSVEEVRDRWLFFHAPKIRSGFGMIFVITAADRVFFFPFAFLDSLRRPTVRADAPIRIDVETAKPYEITSSDDLQKQLAEHCQSAKLLAEEEFGELAPGGAVPARPLRLQRRATKFSVFGRALSDRWHENVSPQLRVGPLPNLRAVGSGAASKYRCQRGRADAQMRRGALPGLSLCDREVAPIFCRVSRQRSARGWRPRGAGRQSSEGCLHFPAGVFEVAARAQEGK
ncbi:unnamed protein product [Amoebophrya sp. A120]|nr:unnamed protein product [Amoebophrya sp. A120]|eukprot:GSA120T00004547001.1